MSEIKWMIRTRHNHLLGPISKSKLLELLDSGSLDQEDEICSGNGYWFKIKETEFINRFVKGAEIQGFNPVSEALTEQRVREEEKHKNRLDDLIKKQTHTERDVTQVISLDQLNQSVEAPVDISENKKVIIQNLNKQVKKEERIKDKANTLKTNVEYKKIQRARIEESSVHYPFWSRIIVVRTFLILFLLILIFMLVKGVDVVDFISSAQAQTFSKEEGTLSEKIEYSYESSEMKFIPILGFNGFRIESEFLEEEFECDDVFEVERMYFNRFNSKKKV